MERCGERITAALVHMENHFYLACLPLLSTSHKESKHIRTMELAKSHTISRLGVVMRLFIFLADRNNEYSLGAIS